MLWTTKRLQSLADRRTFADNDDPDYKHKQVASITLSSSAPMTASAALLIIDSCIILLLNIHHAAKRHCGGSGLNASSYCSFFSMQLATDLHFFCMFMTINCCISAYCNFRSDAIQSDTEERSSLTPSQSHFIISKHQRCSENMIPDITVPTKLNSFLGHIYSKVR